MSSLGVGGMGEVYRARDTRLGRDVAVKVIAADGASRPDRLHRFEQEARVLAALDHPNILSVHDFGTENGIAYIVFELLEGETLRQRLEHGALPARKAVELAVQMCRGLAAAHARGIVHRDLKPENLFLTRDGRLKILDFGLAKLSESPEREAALQKVRAGTDTEPGILLGTVGYMSPEQARGLSADARSDLFAVGAVLYEMLSGRRAFEGATPADLVSAIRHVDPPPLAPAGRPVSPAVEGVVRHCLEKRPEDRFQSAHDVALALEALGQEEKAASPGKKDAARREPGPRLRRRLGVAFGVLLLAAAAARSLRPAPMPRITSVKNLTDGSFVPTSAVTDGRNIYFADRSHAHGAAVVYCGIDGEARLMVMSTDGGEPREVPLPWNKAEFQIADLQRDGAALLLIDTKHDGQLWRVPVPAGTPSRLGDIVGAMYAAWSPEGDRLAYVAQASLYVADADGRHARKLVARPPPGELLTLVGWAQDGARVRYAHTNVFTTGDSIWDADVSGQTSPRLVIASGLSVPLLGTPPGNWTPDGRYFVFARSGEGLLARRERALLWSRETESASLATPPSLIAPRVTPDGRHVVAIQWRQLGQLQRFDRTTRAFAPILGGISAVHVEFSPDGEWVAWASYNGCGPGNRLWRARRDGSDRVKLSELDVDCMVPLHWSPDGRRIAFAATVQESGRTRFRVYLVAAEGGPAEPLLPIERAGTDGAFCWAPDGESLVMHEALPYQDVLRRIDVKTRHVTTLPDSKGLADPKCARNGRILARDWSDYAAQEAQKKRFIYKMLEPGHDVWTSYALPAEIGYSTWSRDSQFIYAMDRSRLYRLQLSTGHLELIAAVDGFRLGHGWMGLAPDDSPLVLRDAAQWDIYRLDWDVP